MIQQLKNIASLAAIITICIFGSTNFSHAQDHHLTIGVNALTPLGALPQDNYDKLSFVSKNMCISFHGEYRYKQFAARLPIRIPLDQYDSKKAIPDEEFFSYRSPSYNNYEVGLLPTYYFADLSQRIQPFTYLGMYFGNSYSIGRNEYSIGEYNAQSNNYSTNIVYTREMYQTSSFNYVRPAFGVGCKLRLNESFSLESDVSVSFGKFRRYESNQYSNIETSDGVPQLDWSTSYVYTVYAVQMGLTLNYQIF